MSGTYIQNRGRDRLERQAGREGGRRTEGGDSLVLGQIRFLTDDDCRERRDILCGVSYGVALTPRTQTRTDLEVPELFVNDLDHVKALTRGD